MNPTIHQIEEVSLTTWPALQTAFYDGWVLRFAEGFTRRSNSVNALYPSTLDPAQKIEHCVQWFQAREIRPVFKLTDAVEPAGLDAILDQQGYAREGSTSVQTLDLSQLASPSVDGVRLAPQHSADWVAACVRFNNFDPARAATLNRILDNMTVQRAFASIQADGEIVAVGIGVAAQGYLSLFDIATAPEHRNQGLARRVVTGLLGWGKSQGAALAFLQVVPQNAPALHLYERLGFRERYQYWYRA